MMSFNYAKIKFKDKINFTQNLFEDVDVIRNARLKVVEINEQGDHLCIVSDKYMVDIDHRDIDSVVYEQTSDEELMDNIIVNMLKKFDDRGYIGDEFCNGCEFIAPSQHMEEFLKLLRHETPEHHICTLLNTIIDHHDDPRKLPKHRDCPLNKK